MKRLIVCSDGTWSTQDQRCPTNVVKLHRALAEVGADGAPQLSCYVQGVGTSTWQRLAGGAFGWGLSQNVKQGYRFLVEHFEPGDELYFFGFSRGAYTARSLAGLVRNAGVLRAEHAGKVDDAYSLYRDRDKHPRGEEAARFRAAHSHESRVRCIGVWDTVGSLGIPLTGLHLFKLVNRPWQFHDTDLSSHVDAAYHAMAIDERRGPFSPTLWSKQPPSGRQEVEQVWFSGVHSDVGGGYPDDDLADIALLWMVERARRCGLAVQDPPDTDPRIDGRMHDSYTDLYVLTQPSERQLGEVDPTHEYAASSAVARQDRDPSYAPNLRRYRDSTASQEQPVQAR